MKDRRNTKQRNLILSAVRNRFDHPTAEDIYSDVIIMDPKISKGTVYRNLSLLSENGQINHIRLYGHADRYDLRVEKHHHFFCTVCGNVTDVPLKYDALLDKKVEKCTECLVTGHQLVFEGICSNCRTKEN